jgi:hypothetical protein
MVHCSKPEKDGDGRIDFPVIIAVLGILSLPVAAYFVYSFRRIRNKVQNEMSAEIRPLFRSEGCFRQLEALALVYVTLLLAWAVIVFGRAKEYWPLWCVLFAVDAGFGLRFYSKERPVRC